MAEPQSDLGSPVEARTDSASEETSEQALEAIAAKVLRGRNEFGLQEVEERGEVVVSGVVGRGAPVAGTVVENGLERIRASKLRAVDAAVDLARPENETLVSNSTEPTCAQPKALIRMQSLAESNGWGSCVLYGRARIGRMKKADDAEQRKAGNQTKRKVEQEKVMQWVLADVGSVSLRMRRGPLVAYGCWSNGKWAGGGIHDPEATTTHTAGVREVEAFLARPR